MLLSRNRDLKSGWQTDASDTWMQGHPSDNGLVLSVILFIQPFDCVDMQLTVTDHELDHWRINMAQEKRLHQTVAITHLFLTFFVEEKTIYCLLRF